MRAGGRVKKMKNFHQMKISSCKRYLMYTILRLLGDFVVARFVGTLIKPRRSGWYWPPTVDWCSYFTYQETTKSLCVFLFLCLFL